MISGVNFDANGTHKLMLLLDKVDGTPDGKSSWETTADQTYGDSNGYVTLYEFTKMVHALDSTKDISDDVIRQYFERFDKNKDSEAIKNEEGKKVNVLNKYAFDSGEADNVDKSIDNYYKVNINLNAFRTAEKNILATNLNAYSDLIDKMLNNFLADIISDALDCKIKFTDQRVQVTTLQEKFENTDFAKKLKAANDVKSTLDGENARTAEDDLVKEFGNDARNIIAGSKPGLIDDYINRVLNDGAFVTDSGLNTEELINDYINTLRGLLTPTPKVEVPESSDDTGIDGTPSTDGTGNSGEDNVLSGENGSGDDTSNINRNKVIFCATWPSGSNPCDDLEVFGGQYGTGNNGNTIFAYNFDTLYNNQAFVELWANDNDEDLGWDGWYNKFSGELYKLADYIAQALSASGLNYSLLKDAAKLVAGKYLETKDKFHYSTEDANWISGLRTTCNEQFNSYNHGILQVTDTNGGNDDLFAVSFKAFVDDVIEKYAKLAGKTIDENPESNDPTGENTYDTHTLMTDSNANNAIVSTSGLNVVTGDGIKPITDATYKELYENKAVILLKQCSMCEASPEDLAESLKNLCNIIKDLFIKVNPEYNASALTNAISKTVEYYTETNNIINGSVGYLMSNWTENNTNNILQNNELDYITRYESSNYPNRSFIYGIPFNKVVDKILEYYNKYVN